MNLDRKYGKIRPQKLFGKSSLFSLETEAVKNLRYKVNAEQRLTKCINIKGSLLKCLCGSPEAAFKKCFVQNKSIEDTPFADKPNVSTDVHICTSKMYHLIWTISYRLYII